MEALAAVTAGMNSLAQLRKNLFVIVIDIMWAMRQWEITLFIPQKLIACIGVSGRTILLLLFSWSLGWRWGKGSKRHIEGKFYCIMWAVSLIYQESKPHGTNYRSELGIAFNNKKRKEKWNITRATEVCDLTVWHWALILWVTKRSYKKSHNSEFLQEKCSYFWRNHSIKGK